MARRHAADYPSPRDGRENRFDFRQNLRELQSHRPLAGDDLRSLYGARITYPCCAASSSAFDLALGAPGPTITMSAPSAAVARFDRGALSRHHDEWLSRQRTRRVGHALRMIALE